MSEGLGLLITPDHEETIASLAQIPVTYGASDKEIPDEWIPPLYVESQGNTNSCGGHTEAAACSHANYFDTGEVIRFSRRFAYLTAQSEGGFLGADQGTSIHSLIAAATKYGCCREETFPFTERYSPNWTIEAQREAYQHRHHGETVYDLRRFEDAMAWLTDRRCICIGTRWYSGQDACRGIEDKRVGSSGSFRGYHARLLSGHKKHGGVQCPVVLNSHGRQWGDNGRAVITPDLWDWWLGDSNFVALAYTDIQEVEPKRRSWVESKPGDEC